MAGDETTLLTISGDGVPPFSARYLTQTLTPIDAAKQLRRTVNGAMRDLSASQFRKLKTTISCTDQQPPAFDSVDIGAVLTMGCVAELGFKTAGGAPARPVVAGSLRTEGAWTFYRPELTVVLVAKSQSEDECPDTVQWTAEFEEE